MRTLVTRAAALILAAAYLICLPCLTSCGIIIINDGTGSSAGETTDSAPLTDGQTDNTSVTTALTSAYVTIASDSGEALEASKSALDAVTSRDFDGLSVFIATTAPDQLAPDEVGDDISEACYERRRMVEEKLNTTILTVTGTADSIYESLRQSALSGEYYADIVSVPSSRLGLFVYGGLLSRLNSLPFLDLGAAYFDSNAIAQASAGYGSVYSVYGKLNEELNNMYSVLWNRAIAYAAGLDNLYKYAYSGSWTYERLLACVSAAAPSGSGYYGVGVTSSVTELLNAVFASTGKNYFAMGDDGALHAYYGGERSLSAVEVMKKLLGDSGNPLGSAQGMVSGDCVNSFYAGNMLFCFTTVGSMEWFKNMKSDWGVLPMPKLDETQESYYSYLSPETLTFSVPASVGNIDNTGVFISAFAAASGDYISDALYTKLIKYVVRDNDTLNMLDLIREKPVVDFALLYGSGWSMLEAGTSGALYNVVLGKASLTYYYNYYSAALNSLVRGMK